MRPVVIVGGGLSGLAAGVTLSRLGVPVLILEQKPFLGGRAYSFRDAATGAVVDNGQHLLICGYDATFSLLTTIGTVNLVRVQKRPELTFFHPDRGFCTLRLPRLPSPVHLFAGMIRTTLFSRSEKGEILRGGAALLRDEATVPEEWTVAAWLRAHGQGEETLRSFWEPVAIAIMNEHVGSASARVFVRSLRTAFLSRWQGAALATPAVGLSELYAGAARGYIERHGGSVRTSSAAEGVRIARNNVDAVLVRQGGSVECRAVIAAVPPRSAVRVLPPEAAALLAPLETVPASPIVSLHLWFPGSFMMHDVVGVIGRRIQWIFRKERYISATISAARRFVTCSDRELVSLAVEDLQAIYGEGIGHPLHSLVIREKRATFSCSPAAERVRPDNATPVANLFLAGDWTGTGLPATIESAVVSGNRAADMVVRCLRAAPPP